MIHYPNVTRADLRDRIGISDDALEHLLKRNVIRPAGLVQGRGNRRTFAADDVMIAAVAAELHRYHLAVGLLAKISNRLYEAVGLARSLELKSGELAHARHAVEQQLALVERGADAAFDAYHGLSTGLVALASAPNSRPDSSLAERIAGLDAVQLVTLDLYLTLVDPRYLESDPPCVRWLIAPLTGSDDYRLSCRVGAEAQDSCGNSPSWITISMTKLARRVWLTE